MTSQLPAVALVVAAGSGSRLGGGLPKALRELGGVPLVRRSVDQLVAGGADSVVVVVRRGFESDFQAALAGVEVPVRFVAGGVERQQSVALGLDACAELVGQSGQSGQSTGPDSDATLIKPSAAAVLIHDAARPLVPVEVVRSVLGAIAAGHPAVIPVVPVIDSIRRVCGDSSQVVPRHDLVAVQTPQGFDLATVRRAHDHVAAEGLVVTDDAACCEAIGIPVHLVAGSRSSMKITEPEDLLFAESLLAERT